MMVTVMVALASGGVGGRDHDGVGVPDVRGQRRTRAHLDLSRAAVDVEEPGVVTAQRIGQGGLCPRVLRQPGHRQSAPDGVFWATISGAGFRSRELRAFLELRQAVHSDRSHSPVAS